MIQLRPDLAFTNETPYLTLTGELRGAFRDVFKEIRARYDESPLLPRPTWVSGLSPGVSDKPNEAYVIQGSDQVQEVSNIKQVPESHHVYQCWTIENKFVSPDRDMYICFV